FAAPLRRVLLSPSQSSCSLLHTQTPLSGVAPGCIRNRAARMVAHVASVLFQNWRKTMLNFITSSVLATSFALTACHDASACGGGRCGGRRACAPAPAASCDAQPAAPAAPAATPAMP